MARGPADGVEIRLLGPLQVWRRGEQLELAGGRQRALLAILALNAGDVVSSDRLLEELWDGQPPPTAAKALQNLVSQLRRTIDPEQSGVLLTRAPGYVLDIEPRAIDARRFERLASEGHAALEHEPAQAGAQLREALALWRGDALAEFAYQRFAQTEIARLDEIRAGALEGRIDADLALGRHAELVPELETLTADHPLNERLRRQHMLALYRCGRQAEALEGYRALRARLKDELGLEPGPESRRLEQAILGQDPALGPVPRLPPPLLRKRPRRLGILLRAAILSAAGIVGAAALLIGGSSTPAIVADSLVKIDARTNEVVDVVPVGREPGPVVIVGPYVFVSSAGDNTLSRVDRRSGDVITVGGFATPRGLGPDGDSLLWVVNEGRGEVVQIDTKTMERLDQVAVPSAGLGYVAVGGGSLWLNELPPGAVSRWRLATVDLQTRYRLEPGTFPLEVGFADGAAWFALIDSGEVLRVDATDGSTSRVRVGSGPGGPPTPGFGSIWVSTADGTVWRVDLATRKPVAIVQVGGEPFGLAVGAGSVWVANQNGSVARIDPTTDQVVATVETGFFPQWLAADGRYVWVGLSASRWDFVD
jgi:DNA-binding SARP family transcriptional activator/streptogramin lyase